MCTHQRLDDLRPNQRQTQRLEAALRDIVAKLPSTDVVRAILFGSLASGNVGAASDVDLLVVRPTAKRFIERAADLYELFDCPVGLDVLVYTPAEFERMKRQNPLVKRAVQTGRLVYESGP